MPNSRSGYPINPDVLHFGSFASKRITFIYSKSGNLLTSENESEVHGDFLRSKKIVDILNDLNPDWAANAKKIGYNYPGEIYDLLNYSYDSLKPDDIKLLNSLGISTVKLRTLHSARSRLQSTGKLLFGRSAVISSVQPQLIVSLWGTPNPQLIEQFRSDSKVIGFFESKYKEIPKKDWVLTVKNDYDSEKSNVSEYRFFSKNKIEDKLGELEQSKKLGANKLLQYLQKQKGIAPKTAPEKKPQQTDKKYYLSFGTFNKADLEMLRNDVHVGSAQRRKEAISILCKISEKDLADYPELEGYIPPGCDDKARSSPSKTTWGKISRDLASKQNQYSHITASESFSFKNFFNDRP